MSFGVVVDDEDGLRSSCWAMVKKMASRQTTLDDMISVVFDFCCCAKSRDGGFELRSLGCSTMAGRPGVRFSVVPMFGLACSRGKRTI